MVGGEEEREGRGMEGRGREGGRRAVLWSMSNVCAEFGTGTR